MIGPANLGQIPAAVFNATLAETGQRLLISPVVRRDRIADHPAAVEFLHLFPGEANPYVPTVVRLSAAFPYVSPISRARYRYAIAAPHGALQDCHVVDGGYVDNEGALTAMEWIDDLLEAYGPGGGFQDSAPFNRVVVVRIFPFPAGPGETPMPSGRGWANELMGPISALQKVRVASQQERNSSVLSMMRRFHDPQANVFREYKSRIKDQSNERPTNDPHSVRHIPVEEVSFYFQPDEGELPPLSWKLTHRQTAAIERAWVKQLDYERSMKEDKENYTQVIQDNAQAALVGYPLYRLDDYFDVVWRPQH
jgi:hypothetical protein